MCKIAWSACVALVVLGFSFESAGYAKPPDLPVDLGVEFDQADNPRSITLGYDFLSGNLLFSFSMPWKFVLPWQAAPTAQPQTESKGDDIATPQAVRRQQARALFATAERCLKNGDVDKARTCYEETHLLAPETRVGRRAIERLSEIDNTRTIPVTGAGEEQEPREPVAPSACPSRN
jgi:hypothetical protein